MPLIMKPNASRYLIDIARISPLWFSTYSSMDGCRAGLFEVAAGTKAAGGLCVAFRGPLVLVCRVLASLVP